MMRIVQSMVACVVMLASVGNVDAGIINGSFETPVIVGPNDFEVFAGGSNLGGWTVVGIDVLTASTTRAEIPNGIAAFNSQDGVQSLDLTGVGNTGLTDGVQQFVATILGQEYRLSFYVGRAGGGPLYSTPSTVDLSIDGGTRVSYTNSGVTPSMVNWQEFSTTFTASNNSTLITFFNGTDSPSQFFGPNNFVGLDNVRLQQTSGVVPEPTSLAIFGFGALGLFAGGIRRRTQKQMA